MNYHLIRYSLYVGRPQQRVSLGFLLITSKSDLKKIREAIFNNPKIKPILIIDEIKKLTRYEYNTIKELTQYIVIK